MKKFNFILILSILAFVMLSINSIAQDAQKQYRAATIAFYNLENLFDTIDSPDTDDAEFLPGGGNAWNSQKYAIKIKNMSEVIAQIGSDIVKGGPTIIGVSEIENRFVLEELIASPALKNAGYDIVHYDSPDARGVDVGLLYKKSAFKVTATSSVRLKVAWRDDFKSRDQLVVTGELDGESISIVVNHWPSRGNGPEYRDAAAQLSRHIADSLFAINPKAKIFIMGDLNDDPVDPSVLKVLKAYGKTKDVHEKDLFNPMWQLFKDGIGSLGYRDSWNLFDQIVISDQVLNAPANSWKLLKTRVFNPKFLISQDGQFAGYPFRTFSFGTFIGGYSDHLPVYVVIVKEK